MPPSSVPILGVPIHCVTVADTLALVERFVAEGTPRQICTTNPEFVMRARRDPEFREVLTHSDLNIPDGIGLLWAARQLGQPLPERVPGSTMIYWLSERAAAQGWRIFLLGAAPGVAEKTASVLQSRYPGLKVVGTFAGSPRPEDEADILRRLQLARPDILLVAFGAPAQDLWIFRNKAKLGIPVSMGVGGSFDFVAGVAKRAPEWMQRLGLEWLHRLWHQPWRARRIWTAVVEFSWAVWRSSNAH